MRAPGRITQPVIAAVHGPKYGLALDALCAIDVHWPSSDAQFSINEVDGALAQAPSQAGCCERVIVRCRTARLAWRRYTGHLGLCRASCGVLVRRSLLPLYSILPS